MSFGGLHHYPRKLGGGETRLSVILNSLNSQRGTAYDVTYASNVYAENMAIARCIGAGWSTNERVASLWNPDCMDEYALNRWEKMLHIIPKSSDSIVTRRARIKKRWQRFGTDSNVSQLETEVSEELGDTYVAIEYISNANAVIRVPDGTYPWGTASTTNPWYSTICHILVRTTKPSGMTEGEFYETVSKMHPLLNDILPAWVTWDWYRPGPVSVSVSGGPSAGGFYFDDEHNFDNEVFDV